MVKLRKHVGICFSMRHLQDRRRGEAQRDETAMGDAFIKMMPWMICSVSID